MVTPSVVVGSAVVGAPVVVGALVVGGSVVPDCFVVPAFPATVVSTPAAPVVSLPPVWDRYILLFH